MPFGFMVHHSIPIFDALHVLAEVPENYVSIGQSSRQNSLVARVEA